MAGVIRHGLPTSSVGRVSLLRETVREWLRSLGQARLDPILFS
jgi:hypothetical protein